MLHVRLPVAEYQYLHALAFMRRASLSDLARERVLAGMVRPDAAPSTTDAAPPGVAASATIEAWASPPLPPRLGRLVRLSWWIVLPFTAVAREVVPLRPAHLAA